MSLHLAKVVLSVLVQVPEQVFDRHLPSSPRVVGAALADAVAAYALENRLGYYPALDFFQEHRALNALAALKAGLAKKVVALRDGRLVYEGGPKEFTADTFRDIYGEDAEPASNTGF